MFDKLKNLMEMQKKMGQVKQELDNTDFQMKSACGLVSLTMNGSQQVKSVNIAEGFEKEQKTRLENAIKDAYNRAIKYSHELGARKMKEMTGLDLPGL